MARADRLSLAPQPVGVPTAVWVAALLAVAGHAALLLAPWDDDRAGRPGAVATAGRPAAQVRLLGPDDRPERTPSAAIGPHASVTPHRAAAIDSAGPVVLTPPGTAASAPDPAPAVVTTATDEDALFLVRSQLDRPPNATGAIDLPYPESAPLGHYRAVMTLFIDQDGQVRRVRLDAGQVLPPLLEDAARQAFLQARFEPGLKNGAAVRSRMRVAVEFGADPVTPPAALPSASAASR